MSTQGDCDFRRLCIQMGYSEIVSSSRGYGPPLQEARLTILNLQLLSVLWHPSAMLHRPSCLASRSCTHCLLLSYFRKAFLPQQWLAMDHLPTPLFPREVPMLRALFRLFPPCHHDLYIEIAINCFENLLLNYNFIVLNILNIAILIW